MLCDCRVLAVVVQTFSQHIVERERLRRASPNELVFSALEWDNMNVEGTINVAFCGHDLCSMSPTHDLTYGTISHFLESSKYNILLVVRTHLQSRKARKAGVHTIPPTLRW